MTTFDPARPEDLTTLEAQYWAKLEATLAMVFDADRSVADEYRRSLAKAPPFQRALALHDEPLDVAAILTAQPVTADRAARYDDVIAHVSARAKSFVREPATRPTRPRDVLSTTRREDGAPMVSVKLLNRLMEELGYHRLAIEAGVAYFALDRKSWKKPLLRRFDMEAMPGLTADREEVYGLDRVVNMLDALQEHARRRNPTSTIVARIEKMKVRLVRSL